jgi:hypothetical protein
VSDPYGLGAAMDWVGHQFPYIPERDQEMLVRGVAGILYPHAAVAAISDMSDQLSEQFPDVADALDTAAVARRAELTQGAPS